MNPLRVLYPILCLVYQGFVELFGILSKGIMDTYCASCGNFFKYLSNSFTIHLELPGMA